MTAIISLTVYFCRLLKNYACILGNYCLPKGRHSEGPHEIHPISSQNCSRGGVGWGWGGEGCVMQGCGGVGHAGLGWVM